MYEIKTDWKLDDVVMPEDMNRIETNISSAIQPWAANVTYAAGQLCYKDGVIYKSLAEDNLGHEVMEAVWWSALDAEKMNEISAALATVNRNVGELKNLPTTDKSSVAAAINEINATMKNSNAETMKVSPAVQSLYGLAAANANVDKALQAARTLITNNVNLINTKTRMASGSYTGKYTEKTETGSSYPTVVNCGFKPKIIIITDRENGKPSITRSTLRMIAINPSDNVFTGYHSTSSTYANNTYVKISYTNTGVSFYIEMDNYSSPRSAYNYKGAIYDWVAFI